MKQKTWEKHIKDACKKAGTYRDFFDHTISTLAAILEKRDEAQILYEEMGSLPVISYTNKGGATNLVKNPALVVWDDLNKSALAYWRDLGLTPAGLKKIDDAVMKKKKNGLAEALRELGG